MRKLRAVAVTDLAGYREIAWSGFQPDQNLLVGRNGAGKSTLLEAIVVGLNYMNGRRIDDLLTGQNPEATIRLVFSDDSERAMNLGEMRTSQTPAGTRPVENVLYVHEERRPRRRLGKSGRSRLSQHPTRRYDFVLNELQALLLGSSKERAWAEGLLAMARDLRHSGHPSEWEWAREILPRGSRRISRPMSCGQYDVLSLLLDVIRTSEALAGSELQPFVILDNPEAFLHPALQEEIIAWIRCQLRDAQIFMASHSLKLLAGAQPASVFWLSRDLASGDGRVTVQPVRELTPDAQRVFFELYGDDTSSAVLNLILGLESSEYLAFLCACALPCRSVARPEPVEEDVQIRAIAEELRHFGGPWTLLDVGAGTGDLLVGAERLGIANSAWEYVALEENPSRQLLDRVTRSRDVGRIAPGSRVVTRMEESPCHCDAVVFANVCHALDLERLAEWLAAGLHRLRPSLDSRCVIQEVEVLRRGERGFVMWTPEDYSFVFGKIPAVAVEERHWPRPIGVPIHATVLTRREGKELPTDLSAKIKAAFETLIPLKLERLMAERQSLSIASDAQGLNEAVRQRRRAFVSEQCSNIVELLWKRGALSRGISVSAAEP